MPVPGAIEVPGLPAHIRFCPPPPLGPGHETDDEMRRGEWHAWRRDLIEYRVKRQLILREHPEKIPLEYELCRRSKKYWLCMYGWMFEVREERNLGIEPGDKPWIPYNIQLRMLDWMDERMQATGADRDGVDSKSRTMGASWTACGWATHGWIFEYPWKVFFMSRVQELVESKSSDSLFWKIDYILDHLPAWQIPEGYSKKNKEFNSDLIMVNPANGNQLAGGSTTPETGRSGRFTAVIVDEAAKVPELQHTLTSITATTFHWFLISSESNRLSMDFYNMGVGNKNAVKPSLLEMNYWENPYHTPAFMREERERFEARGEIEAFHQEYLRDARAGGALYVYPYAAALSVDNSITYQDMGILYATIDPGRNDECAVVWIQWQYPIWAVLGAYQARGKEAAFIASLIAGRPALMEDGETERFHYTHAERQLMEWTATLDQSYLSNGNFFGDFNGRNKYGTTNDSWYSIMEEEAGIFVNADRNDLGELISDRKKAREIAPRIEFLRQILPLFRFSAENNAPFVLDCLRDATFVEESGRATTEPSAPKHDITSHVRTACEYFAAHVQLRHNLEDLNPLLSKRRAYQNSRDLHPTHPDFKAFGRTRRFGRIPA